MKGARVFQNEGVVSNNLGSNFNLLSSAGVGVGIIGCAYVGTGVGVGTAGGGISVGTGVGVGTVAGCKVCSRTPRTSRDTGDMHMHL